MLQNYNQASGSETKTDTFIKNILEAIPSSVSTFDSSRKHDNIIVHLQKPQCQKATI